MGVIKENVLTEAGSIIRTLTFRYKYVHTATNVMTDQYNTACANTIFLTHTITLLTIFM